MFSIICVTWKNQKQALECVDSIRKYSHFKDHEIIVVHNELDLKDFNIHGAVNIGNKENVGLSEAANAGAYIATKDYICLIDDDTTVTQDWDKHLYDARMKTGSDWISSTVIEPIAPKYNIELKAKSCDKIKVPEKWYRNISNTPLLIPRFFWEIIGGYDEDFPTIGAELGLAKRAYDHGTRDFVQTPHSIVFHKQSQSIKRLGAKEAKILRGKRETDFQKKYKITRKQFIRTIGKGEVYNDISL